MNKDFLSGKWNEVKGILKEKYGKLTDDELTQVEGKKDQLIGLLQKKYGLTQEQAEAELNKMEQEKELAKTTGCDSCGCSVDDKNKQ